MFTIHFVSSRIERELQRLQAQDRTRIAIRLQQLKIDPRPQGILALDTNIYRLRIGQFTVIYEVNDEGQEITILRITRRNERTYRSLDDLF